MTRQRKVTEFSDNGGRESERWHVNRGIPIVWLLGTVGVSVGQLCALFWYAGQFNTRVDIVEKTMALIAPQGERLTRLEEKVVSVQATANRIETLLTSQVKAR